MVGTLPKYSHSETAKARPFVNISPQGDYLDVIGGVSLGRIYSINGPSRSAHAMYAVEFLLPFLRLGMPKLGKLLERQVEINPSAFGRALEAEIKIILSVFPTLATRAIFPVISLRIFIRLVSTIFGLAFFHSFGSYLYWLPLVSSGSNSSVWSFFVTSSSCFRIIRIASKRQRCRRLASS